LNATDPLGLKCKHGHKCSKPKSRKKSIAGAVGSAVAAIVASGPYKPGSSGGPTAGKRVSASQRQTILQENNGKCVYCNDGAEHVDHIIPRSKGGNTEFDNLQPACSWCNISKLDREAPNPKYPNIEYVNPTASNAILSEELSDGSIAEIEQSGEDDLLPAPGTASEIDIILDISAITG
jgi:hypothetical protein